MLQKKKAKLSNNDDNTVQIQNKKNSVRNTKVSFKNKNNSLDSNKIINVFKNKNKDYVIKSKTKSKNKKKLLNEKISQNVETQPKNIKMNKDDLETHQSNNIVKENTFGKNNEFQKKQKLNLKNHGSTQSPKKRKANGDIINGHKDSSLNIKIKDLDFHKADELIINAKKNKLNEVYQQEDKEDQLFPQENKNRAYSKKQKIKQMLEKNDVNRNSIKVNGNDLRTRMLDRLKGNYLKNIDS